MTVQWRTRGLCDVVRPPDPVCACSLQNMQLELLHMCFDESIWPDLVRHCVNKPHLLLCVIEYSGDNTVPVIKLHLST